MNVVKEFTFSELSECDQCMMLRWETYLRVLLRAAYCSTFYDDIIHIVFGGIPRAFSVETQQPTTPA